jgi:predicted permease
METLLQDLRYAVRRLAKAPGFTIAAVLTLALGIGPNTAIFTLIYGVLLKPLPYVHPERLVSVDWQFGGEGIINSVTATQFTYWRDHSRSFAAAGGYADAGSGFNLVSDGTPEYVRGQIVTADLFQTLGVVPARGRPFSADEDQAGGPPAVIISDALWHRDFGSDPQIAGKVLRISGAEYPVVGVMPLGFVLGDETSDLWLPMRLKPDPRDQGHNTQMIARLAPGITLGQAQAEMPGLLAGLRGEVPGHVGSKEHGVVLRPYHTVLVADSRPYLLLLLGAVALVVLIAVANAAGLFLGRTAARRHEVAVRRSLGAGRWALARPLLTESVVLALAGGAAGVLLGAWTLDLLQARSAQALSARPVQIEWPVLAVTLALSIVSGLVVGLGPVLRVIRSDMQESLGGGDRAIRGSQRARTVLVTTEIALSLVLVVSAALLIVSISDLWRVRPGFDPSHVSTVQVSLSGPAFTTAADVSRLESTVSAGFAGLPGVRAVATSTSLPVERGLNGWVEALRDGKRAQTYVETRVVSGDYFGALGIPLQRGREFAPSDAAGAPRVAVINAALAKVYWPDGGAVGNQVWVDGNPCEVVGVVGDVLEYALDQTPPRMVYVLQTQESDGMTRAVSSWFLTSWIVKTDLPLGETTVRRLIRSVDGTLPVVSVREMNAVLAGSLSPRRFVASLLELFSGLSLLLAAVGIYGVVAFSVTQRRREIGLRMALGATHQDVLGMVLRQGVRLAVAGAVLGALGSLAATRVLGALLFGIHARNPVVLAGAAGMLILVALVACYIPARRATRVDPVVALRME